MISGLLGKKLGMTQIFKDGKCYAVTVVAAGPCKVLQVKKSDGKDGYNAIQLGFEDKKVKSCAKSEIGHAKKHADSAPKSFVREVEWDGKDDIKAGQEITLSVLEKVKYVDVIGTKKGKGFQGVVKRHNFKGGPTTHGQSDRLRAPGSIGASSYPSRVHKGMRMPGQMGNCRGTVRNLEILDIDLGQNIIAINGSVPGAQNGYVILRKSVINK